MEFDCHVFRSFNIAFLWYSIVTIQPNWVLTFFSLIKCIPDKISCSTQYDFYKTISDNCKLSWGFISRRIVSINISKLLFVYFYCPIKILDIQQTITAFQCLTVTLSVRVWHRPCTLPHMMPYYKVSTLKCNISHTYCKPVTQVSIDNSGQNTLIYHNVHHYTS